MTDFITQEGLVTFYSLDKPTNFEGKGALKYTLRLVLDPKNEKNVELREALDKVLPGKKSVKDVVFDGKPMIQINASTTFNTFTITDKDMNLIEAPQTFKGDVVKAQMRISPWKSEKGIGEGINLLQVRIVSHDTSNRVELETAPEGKLSDFLDALGETTNKVDKLAALKG